MAGPHTITFDDGETEDCWCSEGRDHPEDVGDWDPLS